MKLLVLNQYGPMDPAPTAQFLGDLVARAAAEGVDVTVIASNRSYAHPAFKHPTYETWKGVTIRRVATTGFGRSGSIGRAVDYLTFLVGAVINGLLAPKPDVILGLSTPPILGALAVLLARMRGGVSAYWAMDVYPELAFELGAMSPRGIGGRILATISRWTLRSADIVIALGETMSARLIAGGARRVVSVHNWADEIAIRPKSPDESQFRNSRSWLDKFVVLYSGNLGMAHEFDTVLEAASHLVGANVVFAFVGSGQRLAAVQKDVARRGLTNVEFMPAVPREELGDLLAAGDLHLVTLRPGVQGLLVPSKLYGILAAGRPTVYVGPPDGEVHSIVSRGCGTSVACGDVDGVTNAIQAYSADPERRSREGAAARSLFEAEFTEQGQTAKLLKALHA